MTKGKLRTVTFLKREQIDYLDKLSKDALFYQNVRLSRVQILSELVDVLIAMGVRIEDIKLQQANLKEELLRIINNHKEQHNA